MKSKRIVRILSFCMLAIGVIVGSSISFAANTETARVEYELNEQGQTYGHVNPNLPPSVQEFPKLIAAIGIDGTEGYVYADDLHENQPKTEKEVIKYMQLLQEEIVNVKKSGSEYLRYIPLYSEDGKTIIGQFGISCPVISDFNVLEK